MKLDLIVAGVGGQGSILASHLIADAAIAYAERTGEQMGVRVGETFGAAMRGGAVASHVRIGKVEGPLVPVGSAKVVLALEPLEGLRIGGEYLGRGSLALFNTQPIPPVDVKVGVARYPSKEEIEGAVAGLGAKLRWVDANALAQKAGDLRTLNVVMVGALYGTGLLPFSPEDLTNVIKDRVPPKTIDLNLKAFELGRESVAG
ncbi:MAG TPA: indolepyruvate oxidoreductase subunit beta [Bacillota bacterium]|jgi:indolepyruvate ferredoxin oxidoreductase beta subunit